MMKPDIPSQHVDNHHPGKGHGHSPNQHKPGAKLDHDKIDMSLLQFLPNAMLEVCRVMDYGQKKYSRGGFLTVKDAIIRYAAAMWRHYFAEILQGKYDIGDPFYETELGAPFKGKIRHDAQVAVNALFRLECTIREEAGNPDTIKLPAGFFIEENYRG